MSVAIIERWPALPFAAWKDTAATLQLWTQVVGKIRLALTPWLNHSWQVALYVTARGLTTSPIPYKEGTFQIDFDFIDHVLWIRTSGGAFRQLMLRPMTVAEFYADMMIALKELGHRRHDPHHAVRNRRLHSVRSRTPCTNPTIPITRSASGACSAPRMKCCRISALDSSAKRARCIFSGARSIWR